eukprot:107024_1
MDCIFQCSKLREKMMLSHTFKHLCRNNYKHLYRVFCTKTKSIDEIYAQSRSYFYYIDKDGKLYLEETKPKTFVTAFKSIKFLDFFWRHIGDNDSLNIHKDYSWISHCGKELNFIKSQASTPIIFYDIVRKINDDSYRTYENSLDENEQNNNEYYLQFGGSLKIPLNAQSLICDIDSGRLYHKIQDDNTTIKCTNIGENGKYELKRKKYGVIGSHLLLRMSNEFQIVKMSENENSVYDFVWNGMIFDIPVF